MRRIRVLIYGVFVGGLVWLGSFLPRGCTFGGGDGWLPGDSGGAGSGTGSSVLTDQTSKPETSLTPPEVGRTVVEREVTVRIDGNRLSIEGKEVTADDVVKLVYGGNDRNDIPARVRIVRGDDATARAREELVMTLDAQKINYRVE